MSAVYKKLEEVCEILDSRRVPITARDRKAGIYPYYGANGLQDYVAEYIFDDELVLLAEDGGNFGSKERPIAYRVSGKCWVNNHAHVLKAKPLVNVDYAQVTELNTDLIAVKLRMQSVEKFKKPGAFNFISEGDKGELLQQIAPIVRLDDTDEYAKRFDNFMYGLMIAAMEQMPSFKYAQKQLRDIGTLLERKISIPQVKAKLPVIKEVNTDAFWEANDILLFERVRKELRSLMQFLVEVGPVKNPIITHLTDPIIGEQEGIQLDAAYDFEDYRAKVNRYVNNKDNVQEYEKNWVAIFERDSETRLYWEQELETGRIKRSLIDIFFDAYFQIFLQDKQYNITAEDKIVYSRVDHLAKSYQDFIDHYCNGDKSVVLGQMAEYAKCFAETFRPEYCNMGLPAAPGIERMNVIMFGLKNTTLIPYILYVAKNVENQNELRKIYGILESYIMKRMIVHAPTKNYNNLFTSLILNGVLDAEALKERLNKGNDATTFVPSDDDLLIGFKTAKLVNLQTRGILYLLEAGIRSAKSSTALLGFNNYSLEHMMPKKWRNNWPECETDALARQRDSMLLTLGNLAIIPQSLNASIRDSSWENKKAGKGVNNPGLSVCAAGLSTIHDALQQDVWDEEKIALRAEWLFEQARSMWDLI